MYLLAVLKTGHPVLAQVFHSIGGMLKRVCFPLHYSQLLPLIILFLHLCIDFSSAFNRFF